jgi:hypothetical protein
MYSFNDKDLDQIYVVWSISGERGPINAYRWWHKLETAEPIKTEDVEDFAIAFMTQYNKKAPMTF